MLSKKIEEALNKQIRIEAESSTGIFSNGLLGRSSRI